MLALVFLSLSVCASLVAARKVNDFGDSAVVIEKVVYTVNGDGNLVSNVGTILVYGDDGNLHQDNKDGPIVYTFGGGKLYKGDGTTEVSYQEGTFDSEGNVVDGSGKRIWSVLPSAVVLDGVIYKVNDDDSLVAVVDGTVLTVGAGDNLYYGNNTIAYTFGDDDKIYKGDGTTKEEVSYKEGYLDLKGNVVNEDGKIIRSVFGPDAAVIEGVIYKQNDDNSYVAADGTVLTVGADDNLYYKNGTVAYTVGDDDKIYKGDGTSKEEVSFKGGYLDSKGNVVDEDGKIIRSVFGPDAAVIDGVIYTVNDDNNLVAADGTVLTVGDGDNLYYKKNGTVAYTHGDGDGKLYKGDGTTKEEVSYKGGYLDSKGNVVNEDGKIIWNVLGPVAAVIEGVIYKVNDDDSLVAADGTVLTVGDGDNLYYKNGTVAYTHGDGDGKLYKGDGTTKEEVSYKIGYLNSNGNVVDDEGNIIARSEKKNDYAVVIEGVIYTLDADKNLVAKDGTVLVYGDGDNLYYKNGTIAYTLGDGGKVYKGDGTTKEEISFLVGTLDANGNVVDDEGNILAQGTSAGNKTLVPTLLVVLILAMLV